MYGKTIIGDPKTQQQFGPVIVKSACLSTCCICTRGQMRVCVFLTDFLMAVAGVENMAKEMYECMWRRCLLCWVDPKQLLTLLHSSQWVCVEAWTQLLILGPNPIRTCQEQKWKITSTLPAIMMWWNLVLFVYFFSLIKPLFFFFFAASDVVATGNTLLQLTVSPLRTLPHSLMPPLAGHRFNCTSSMLIGHFWRCVKAWAGVYLWLQHKSFL